MENKDKTHTLVLNDDEFHWLYYFLCFKGIGYIEAHNIMDKMK